VEPDELDLPSLIVLASGGVVRAVLDRMAADGFEGAKPSHGYVIQRLVEDEPTITALAESLGITQQGASKQVRDLEQLGYVERTAVPEDQRARRIRLTSSGRALLESGRAARAALEAEVVERVGPRTLASAKKVLAALLEVVELGDRVRTRTVPDPGQ